ncbi:hypothetical protein WR25_06575 [Diploscapter pachys]|uniref:Uncharacterized protein n=1 Tax=Diploscapter pachys TaxID=2018661 RepID=A0A2A2L0P4_9BILA|nr:hypothetical protein WR25_06575 [Diploscapter pachys]
MNDKKRASVDSAKVHSLVAESLRTNNVKTSIDEDEVDSADETEKGRKRKKHKMRRNSGGDQSAFSTAPKHVHGKDWEDMLRIADINGRKRAASNASSVGVTRHGSYRNTSWIESRLKKRECTQFVPSSRFNSKCGCGLSEQQHSEEARKAGHEPAPAKFLIVPGREEITTDDGQSDNPESSHRSPERWSIKQHTAISATDTYGTIIFEGNSSHQTKAQFVRLAFDTEPRDVYHLLSKVWKLPAPKLIITIHGGLTNFDLQQKLARIFRKGILKSARTTDAWIITSGLDSGVVKHVASALQELNDQHSYFLFSDNGTTGRYGAEIILRKQLETFLVQNQKPGKFNFSVPLVCVVLEGGAFTIKVVHDYVTSVPRIPVVVCDGSGRAADLLAFTHHAISDDGKLSDSVYNQLMHLVQHVFSYDVTNAERTVKQLIACAKEKTLMTVFRLGESQRQDVDHAILTALLKGQGLSPSEQLQLALAWNRADIAKEEIFTRGQEWTTKDLHNAMMDALCHDRTEFVQLLLDNGVSMQRFLTYARLECLYNTDKGPTNFLRSSIGVSEKRRLRLTEVGRAMEDLMGNAYKSNYTKDDFKAKYYVFSNRRHLDFNGKANENLSERQKSENLKDDNPQHSMKIDLLNTARNSIISIFGSKRSNADSGDDQSSHEEESLDFTFRYPYSELLLWAILTRRQEMALLMWRHGEEALAKALIASRLSTSMALRASQSTLQNDLTVEFCKNKDQFENLALELLQHCTEHNRDMTLRLLTYELTNWGNETCLSLAAINNNRKFLAHPSCQLLLSDLWLGGLSIRAHPNFKVLGCLFAPFMIFTLGFKSKEQLKLQPRTAIEHMQEMFDSDSSSEEEFSDTEEADGTEEAGIQILF